MEAFYSPQPKLQFRFESDSIKEIWAQIAEVAEVFYDEPCHLCKSTDTIPVARKVDKYAYYELKCVSCGAKLSFGQSKEGGGLFPRRVYHRDHPLVQEKKAKEGDRMKDRGWEKFPPKAEG